MKKCHTARLEAATGHLHTCEKDMEMYTPRRKTYLNKIDSSMNACRMTDELAGSVITKLVGLFEQVPDVLLYQYTPCDTPHGYQVRWLRVTIGFVPEWEGRA
jgi:hypothetical protein